MEAQTLKRFRCECKHAAILSEYLLHHTVDYCVRSGAISLDEHFIASVHEPLLCRVKLAILWLVTTV